LQERAAQTLRERRSHVLQHVDLFGSKSGSPALRISARPPHVRPRARKTIRTSRSKSTGRANREAAG
jgi:hypothetical protein